MTNSPPPPPGTEPAPGPDGVPQLQQRLVTTLYAVAAFVACCGFVISFASFKAFGDRLGFGVDIVGTGVELSHLLPLTVDALAVLATVTLAVQGLAAATYDYARRTLYTTVIVSAVVNSVEHVLQSLDHMNGQPFTFGSLVHIALTVLTGAMAPVSAAAVVHLLTTIAFDRKTARENEGRAAVERAREAERLAADQALATAEAARAAADQAAAENVKEELRQAREQARRDKTPDRPRTPEPPPPAAPEPTPADKGSDAGHGDKASAVRAAVTTALGSGTEFRDLVGSQIAKAAGAIFGGAVTPQYTRQMLRQIRGELMLAWITAQTSAGGRTLGDILVAELVEQFGGDDDVAVAALDTARNHAAATTDLAADPATSTSERG